MKNISKPPARKRTDGIEFDPPHNFVLPPPRFNDLPRDTALYSPDELDRAFVQRSEQMKLCEPYPPLSLRIVSVLLGAFESQASSYLKQLYQINKNAAANNNSNSGIANTILTASNRDLLQKVSVHIPEVLRNAEEEDHPLASLDKDHAVIKKVHESVKGHWIEKRCAMGTFVSSQLRPCAQESGLLSNTVMGEADEPFLDREIPDPLVQWRESAEHAVIQTERAGESAKSIRAAKKDARRTTDTGDRDKATTRNFLGTALGLMELVVQREELRLAHTETAVAELALARRCRQLPAQLFSPGMIMSGQASPVMQSKRNSGAGGEQQQFFAQQFLAQQQLVPLVTPMQSTNPIAASPATTLQPQQLEPLVDELILSFGLIGQ